MKSPCTCLLISDHNMDNLAAYLANDPDWPAVVPVRTAYGQVVQTLAERRVETTAEPADMTVIWTRPESTIGSFRRLANFELISHDQILAEVDDFCAQVKEALEGLGTVLVMSWVMPAFSRGYEMLDLKDGLGLKSALMKMNLRLAQQLGAEPGFFILDCDSLVQAAGPRAYTPKSWYMGKLAYGNEVFKAATRQIKSAFRGLGGKAKKLVVVDLDDTLWGGIVGDIGWKAVNLGGHDPVGEAFADFQEALKSLQNRGVILGIVSKNDEATAMEAVQSHPEMRLRPDDFAGWRINWSDKAGNLVDLVTELNLGLDAVVFLDDNPVERARVREALPDVLVPEWPEDKTLYKKALLELDCFNSPSLSAEDAARTQMYVSERKREVLKKNVGSLEDWLRTIGLKVILEELNEVNLPRTCQLLNKTNQMNLSTRRLTEPELEAWLRGPGRKLWTLRVSDKFGDSGLTGIVGVEAEGPALMIVDFILSCRVMGRKIEELMLATAVRHAREHCLREVTARYLATAKNKPCLEFFQRSGFQVRDETVYYWTLEDEYAAPDYIEVVRA
jgi:FkbH-like protein